MPLTITIVIAASFLAQTVGLLFWLHRHARQHRYWLAMFYVEMLTSEGWYTNGLRNFETLHAFVVRSSPIPLHVLDSTIPQGLNAAIESTIQRKSKKATKPSRPRNQT